MKKLTTNRRLSLIFTLVALCSCAGDDLIENTYVVGEWIGSCVDMGDGGSEADYYNFNEFSSLTSSTLTFKDRECEIEDKHTYDSTGDYALLEKVETDNGYEAYELDLYVKDKVWIRTIVSIQNNVLYFGKSDAQWSVRKYELDFDKPHQKREI